MIIDDEYYLLDEQHDIMELVYKFRFINRKQIQKILGYKVPKSVNPWLKDLVEHKYLGRIYFRNKLLENTKPAIYYLDNEGVQWVRGNHYEWHPEKVKRFYQDKHASERFINHCIALAEIYARWRPFKTPREKRKEDKETTNEYYFSTSSEMWYDKELKTIRPDAHTERWEGDFVHSHFLELIESYVPMYAVRYKIDQYIEFVSSDDYYDVYCGSYDCLKVRLIFSNQQRLRRIGKYIQRRLNESYDVDKLVFLLTTHQLVIDKGLESDIWIELKEE